MDKQRRHGRIRLITQALWFALTNGYAKGFAQGRIYTGDTKQFCVPGLNCYSCPGALAACPIGALQAVLNSRQFSFTCYVLGILMVFGATIGRLICGWLCPFGLIQDLCYKIPFFQKIKNLPGHKYLTKLKYVILAVLVIILPVSIKDPTGLGQPWFCEWLCPSGTLLGGIPLTTMDISLQSAIGFRFAWKVTLLVLILILAVKSNRPFCKYLCPLGAMYGVCNPISLYRYRVDMDKCIHCNACQKACDMDIEVCKTPNSMECIRCGKCKAACPTGAITSSVEELLAKKRKTK